jgi:hypothetical protein
MAWERKVDDQDSVGRLYRSFRGPAVTSPFLIPSSDPARLAKARRTAEEFARAYRTDDVVGVVLLGAVPRGYFDLPADVDLAVFPKRESRRNPPQKFTGLEGIEVHCWWSDYETELAAQWEMSKRWAYSRREILYDPEGKIARLLAEKVPLAADERKWLLMSGCILSEWYGNRLADLWITRGSLASAHQMIAQGLNSFLELLFVLNRQLVPDVKWRHFLAEKLPRLPDRFAERVARILILREIGREELERRRAVFLEMWREMLPVVEREVGMTHAEMERLV